MRDLLTMANINIFAILRSLGELCDLDSETQEIIKSKDMVIQLIVKSGPRAYIILKDGKCSVTRGEENCNIKLYFKSPEHLNEMFNGKANPIPLKGLTQINFLKTEAIRLKNRLSYFLKPTDELLKDPHYFEVNTILSAYVAFMSLVQIGNYDDQGKFNAKRVPKGIATIQGLNSALGFHIISDGKGNLEGKKGIVAEPRAKMCFNSLETVNAILNGKIDFFSCISNGKIQIKGDVPMIESLNKLLSQVPEYLK